MRAMFDPVENAKEKEALGAVQELLDAKIDYDVIFRVRDQQFQAHKEILRIRSSYFANVFSSKIASLSEVTKEKADYKSLKIRRLFSMIFLLKHLKVNFLV